MIKQARYTVVSGESVVVTGVLMDKIRPGEQSAHVNLVDAYNCGVIRGKRMERARRKGKAKNSGKDAV
ncbi:hypothetical protein [Oliverpabstia intestinalis]|uniref:hypothetical protein n=1 Tax=Oliverpabstia intestinalis TaxID=2606633 RepID=UPI003F949015